MEVDELCQVDDMVIFGATEKEFEENVNIYRKELEKKNMKIKKKNKNYDHYQTEC